MIGKIIYNDGRVYVCDDCKAVGKFTSYKAARRSSWAIARNYVTCYCPNCAPMHRYTGCKGPDCKFVKLRKI